MINTMTFRGRDDKKHTKQVEDFIKKFEDDANLKNEIIEQLEFEYREMDSTEVISALNDLISIIGGTRDTNYYFIGDYTIYQTGGMSYGDVPTESFTTFDIINVLQEPLAKHGVDIVLDIDHFQIFLDIYGKYLDKELVKKLDNIRISLNI